MNLASFLLGIIGPLALRVLTALGIGTLTFTGVTEGVNALIQAAVQNYASIPADILGLCAVAGVPQALGIICGAMTARVGMWAAIKATSFVVGGAS